MYISKMTIRNFRNFRSQNFLFKPGVNTLIGENGSGKTNAFFALRLMLDNHLPNSAMNLEETDFNRGLTNWKGHWIAISLHFEDLNSSEGSNLLAHRVEHLTEGQSSGSYHYYFRPKKKFRKMLHKLSVSTDKSHQKLDEILNDITINDYEAVYHFRGIADLSDDTMYEKVVGNFETIDFPDPEGEKRDLLGTTTSQIHLLRSELACTHIKALRDVMSELRKTRKSPLLSLLRDSAKDIQIKDSDRIIEQVAELNKGIGNLDEVSNLAHRVKQTIDSTIGFTYAPNVSIRSELPEDINKLFQSLTLWVGDGENDNHLGRLDDLSLGGANLIYITLMLLEYEYKQPREEKAAHFLLIEEPEAHIHTHIQKTMFENYIFENTQVITTTHSTHISSANKIDSVNILCKEENETLVCHPSNNLSEKECKRIERYLDANRSTLLFSKGIILVEGDAELILIPALFKSVFGLSLDEIGVSLINMSSTVFTHIADLFHEDRIRRKCAIVTDYDQSLISLEGKDYEQLSKEEKDYYNSAKKGEERRQKLNEYSDGNPWVEAFYAHYTFEVDFIHTGNEYEIGKTLSEIYKRERARQDSFEELNSGDEVRVGIETLRLAQKEGKGWFALILSELLTYETCIPKYIIDAIVFSAGHLGLKHLEKMAKFRVRNICGEYEYKDFLTRVAELSTRGKTFEELMMIIKDYLDENDDLFQFMNAYQDNYHVK